jgi:small subunit ribosomal protein S2
MAEQIPAQDTGNFLVPLEKYLKVGLHIGTKFKTKYMEPFIYKVRSDGLSVLNVQKINDRIDVAAKMVSHYEPQDIMIVGKRENSWDAIKLFGEMTGVKTFAGRYKPGILTNPALETFMEAKLMIVADPWPDKNAVRDAFKMGIPIIALCDTNNESNYIDLVVPCNNKGKKSLGLFFWILAREYLKSRGLIKSEKDMKYKVEAFIEEN